MGNIWDHPSKIAMEALTHMEDALIMAPMCAKDKTSEFTEKANGWKVGDTVSFRTHGEYDVDEFAGNINIQNITSSTRPMLIEKHLDVSVEVTSREAALDLDSFAEQVIIPATYKLAEKVDTYVGTKLKDAQGLYLSSGLYGNAADIANLRKAATLQQLAMNRFSLVDLDSEATLLGQTWFNQSQTRGDAGVNTLQSGIMGRVMGMDWASSIAFPTDSFDSGTMVCVTNNDGGLKNVIGDTILVVDTQTATKTLKAGDRITIAGVRRPLVVKTAIVDTSAATEVELAHPITEVIPDNAAVTTLGNGANITLHGAVMDDRSLAVAFPMLDLPEDKVAATASNNGVSIRIVKGYDINTKKTTMSLDLLCGAFCLDPRRITLAGETL